jgi:hypothetical protein
MLQRQLRSVLDAQLAAFSIQYAAALDDARRRTRDETERAFTQKLDTQREEWTARLEAELRAARAEADRRVEETAATIRFEAERRAADTIAQVRSDAERHAATVVAEARADAERRATELVAHARAEAERHASDAIARTRAEIERSAADAIAQARSDAERVAAEAIAQARADAERHASETIAQVRAGADRHAEDAIASARADAERAAADRIAQVRADAERTVADAIAQAKAEAERAAADAIAQATDDAERAASEAIERARAEAERDTAETIARVRADAERHLAESVGRTREELERTLAAERIRAEHAIADERERIESALAAREIEAATARQTTRAVVAALRALDQSISLTHALETLTEHAAAVAGRAAIFVVSGDRLSSFRTAGFPSTSGTPFETSLSGTGLLAHAVRGRELQTSNIDVPPPAFAGIGPDHTAVAVPLSVGERVVAVLYADAAIGLLDGYGPKSHAHLSNRDWADAVDAMSRHASLVLGAVTAARTGQAIGGRAEAGSISSHSDEEQRARRYARLLLSEIILYNEPAIRLGRQQRDLLQRLRPEIDRARRLYEERVPPAIGGRSVYFQQELVQTLADGDAALLGSAV